MKLAVNNTATPYRIEKGVAPPKRHASTKYPFPDMDVGDSFAVPTEQLALVRTASYHWGKINGGKKFSTRKYGDGYRCWRIA